MKVVVNNCWGGYGLSVEAIELLEARGVPDADDDLISRSHPALVEVVEELGAKADGQFAKLVIVEIPDGVDYVIEDYDGMEYVAERHRCWNPVDPPQV